MKTFPRKSRELRAEGRTPEKGAGLGRSTAHSASGICPPASGPSHRRRGTVLVIFALLLVVQLGLVGLVIDGGFLLSTHRQAQNAADAAALAFPMEKLIGQTDATALAAANAIVQNDPVSGDPVGNGIVNAQTLAMGQNVFVPPQDGSSHAGQRTVHPAMEAWKRKPLSKGSAWPAV